MKKITKKVIITASISLLAFGTITGCQKGSNDSKDSDSKLSGMAGTVGNRVEKYEGYLGYGYNIYTSPYYCDESVNANSPIFDTDKLAADGLIYSTTKKKSESIIIGEKSLDSYLKAFSSVVGERWYNSTKPESITGGITSLKSNQALLSLLCVEKRQREFISNDDVETLKDYVTDAFKKDIKNLSAEKFVKKYGTEILSDVYMGGRLQMDFLYTSDESIEISALKNSLHEWRNDYSVEAKGEETEAKGMAQIDKNSKMTCTVYGGSVKLPTNDRKGIMAKYSDWSNSLKDDELAFIASGSSIEITELVEQFSKDKVTLIQQYIDKTYLGYDDEK